MTTHYNAIMIGAGAAGMMCAATAGKRGRKILLLDHATKIGEKIRISGGGRCNFTNIHTNPANFLSENPRFAISALKRFTPQDFIALVQKHGIAYHEKTLGQLFCDHSAQDIIQMLLDEMQAAKVHLLPGTHINQIIREGEQFKIQTSQGEFISDSLVIATGGLSIPKIGATGFGYEIAKQFGLKIIAPKPALVPLTWQQEELDSFKSLAGIAVPCKAQNGKTSFKENMLFTHRGLSGPAILQISSYWQEGNKLTLDLVPEQDIVMALKQAKQSHPKQTLAHSLTFFLPKRLAHYIAENRMNTYGEIGQLPDKVLIETAKHIKEWQIIPAGTEGYAKAEVTKGGVDTNELSSQTMEARNVPGLYFIGEVVDVTGHLGGFNFQWAWASGVAAGQVV